MTFAVFLNFDSSSTDLITPIGIFGGNKVLAGEDEIKSGKPTLRNLSSGREKSIEIKELVNEIKKII